MADLHQALKFDEIAKSRATRAGVDFVVVRNQWGKDEIGFGLHAAPNQFTTAGVQTADFMASLGLQRSGCQFVGRSECFARPISQEFPLDSFVREFDVAFEAFRQAEKNLEQCGIFFEQLEGWGYFYGKQSRGRGRRSFYEFGDGHTVSKSEEMKKAEDQAFQYKFVWVVTGAGDKGWTTHYQPTNPPLSVELRAVFEFLGLSAFANCPHFDFEPCHWSGLLYQERPDSFFDSNAETAHQWFGNHAQNFSPGVENLLRAHALLEPFGMRLLPFPAASVRLKEELNSRTGRPKAAVKKIGTEDAFDVALSFAGTERKDAERLATLVREAGFSVFYDGFYPEDLWGKDLVETFHQIYSKRAGYCVIFVSEEYNQRAWTIHERRSAQERMLKEKGAEYILPVKTNAVELPGMPSTIGYVSLKELGIEKIAELLIKKLKK
jgi:hypothetical protein